MHVLWFEEYLEQHHDQVGGKCAGLGALTRVGLPVPPGFAVTTRAFRDAMSRNHALAAVHKAMEDFDVHDLDALAAHAASARLAIIEAGPGTAVEADVRAAYIELCRRLGQHDVPVAVRSSATAEDLPDASFAGQQDTYLWIRGADAVVAHVVRCWASLYTDRAVAYRQEHGFGLDEVAMAVAVQQMVLPKAAGVAFTLDPTNGDRSKVVIDASWGLGEAVVAGEVTPDNWVVDKVVFEIVKRTVSAKERESVLDPINDCVVQVPLDAERSTVACLSDAEIRAVARLARAAEKHFGCPQDVEWAITGDVVHLLQSRPETVWSTRPRPTVSRGVQSPMDGILNTLLNPVRVRSGQ